MSTKYQISLNGHKCAGPCVRPYTKILHPINLEYMTKDTNFCPVDKFISKNKDGKVIINYVDECAVPDETHTNQLSELLIPQIQFHKKIFLVTYYNINSLEEGIKWIDDNETKPIKTKERIFNCCMEEYGDDLSIVDNRLIQFVKKICLTRIEEIYTHLKYYIGIDMNEVFLINPQNSKYPQNIETIPIIMQYISVKLITIENIQNLLNRLINVNMKKANMITIIVNQFIELIIMKIQKTINII